MARKSSSYYTHLLAFNERREKEGQALTKILPAGENLEDEDLLQMVSAGFLPWAIVDMHKAELWMRILSNLVVREDLAFNEGGEIA